MAILDANLVFGTAVDCKAAGNVLFTDKVDLSAARNIGNIPIKIGWVVTALTVGTGNNIYFELLTDGDPAMGSPKVIGTSSIYVAADLGVGVGGSFSGESVSPNLPYERYLGLRKSGTGAFTALNLSAWVMTGGEQSNIMAG